MISKDFKTADFGESKQLHKQTEDEIFSYGGGHGGGYGSSHGGGYGGGHGHNKGSGTGTACIVKVIFQRIYIIDGGHMIEQLKKWRSTN